MTGVEPGEIEEIADIYKALGNETRIQVLIQLYNGNPVSELTDELGITRSGLQKHIEQMIDAHLLYRPVDSDKTYALTTLGEYFIDDINENQEKIGAVLDRYQAQLNELREEEAETLERMEDAGVNTKELENKLQAEAWNEIQEDQD